MTLRADTAAVLAVMSIGLSALGAAAQTATGTPPDAAKIDLRFAVEIPLRDGVKLSATVYTPKGQAAPAPCIFTLTPYTRQTYHDRGVYFAAHGLPFLTVDVRGRGDSGGVFDPNIQEAKDGYDVVEWLAKQPYCNGKVSMWGGSYAGYNQWATAKLRPPHLATIVPVASPYYGVDFPQRYNIPSPYMQQWLLYTAGHASEEKLFGDSDLWANMLLERFKAGAAFSTLGTAFGFDPPTLRRWMAHPMMDSFWDRYNPTTEQYRALTVPILTITGSYDGDQPGALTHYRNFMRLASPEARAGHYLIIGPWDHPATRTPRAEIAGLKFGPASLVDLPKLHTQWYNWTMAGGPKPDFLKQHVAYYVMGAEAWRYAESLEAVTAKAQPFFLGSEGGATSLAKPGSLAAAGGGGSDRYAYDPRDVSTGDLELNPALQLLTDQSMVKAMDGKELIYETAPLATPTEVSGFFRLSAWIGLDQRDTDLNVNIYEITAKGDVIYLTGDLMRARYRQSLREQTLITSPAPLNYTFDHFTFVSRRLAAGSRLQMVIGPNNSIYAQKNYNSGKPVADETLKDARTVTVTLFHDPAHPSRLYVPMGQPE